MADLPMDMTDEEAAQYKQAQLVDYWKKAIARGREREKGFLKEGNDCLALYESDSEKDNSFNILFSNTETMLPALYNNTPRPDTRRKFNDDDPMGKAASEVVNRILTYALDTGSIKQPSFDDTIVKAVLSALVPGRGLVRVNYDAVFEKDDTDENAERLIQETVTPQVVRWDRVVFGYAESWDELPWMAFEHYMSKAELVENFGEEMAGNLTLSVQESDSVDSKPDGTDGEDGNKDAVPSLERVWELWDRSTKKIYFIAESYKEDFVKVVDDPLKLSSFFPMPKPLMLIDRLRGLTPIPLYRIYKKKAEELNRVNTRITRITAAMKVKGAYFGNTDLTNVLKAEDNSMTPVQDIGATGDIRSMDALIWFFPIDKLTAVLQQLTVRQQELKNDIYEITGISDILRGESAASESATAQNIKNQWGSLRLRRAQKKVQVFARDILRLVAELSVNHLQQKTIQQMTELPYVTKEQAKAAQEVVNQFQLMQQQQAQAAQQVPPGMAQGQPPQPGQPAQPPAPAAPPAQPPQQVMQAQQVLQTPVWEDVLGMLKNGMARSFHIDIETNSTVDVEATEDKQNIAEFLNALAQFMNGITPMVENGTMPFGAAKAMLLALVRRYRFGTEVEAEIDKMQPPQAPQQPGQAADQANAQLINAKTQAVMQSIQQNQEIHQAKLQQIAQDIQNSAEMHQARLIKAQETK